MTFKKTITKRDGTDHIVEVDDKHKDILKVKWYINNKGYVCKNIRLESGKQTTLKLHRVIMGLERGDRRVVDHLNHNTLDNTTKNLEIKTHQENLMNTIVYKNNSSGTTGVYWNKKDKRWRAFIRYNNKLIHLGNFKEKDDAIKARKTAEVKYFSEHSYDACQSKNNV